jgi:hypothetical protein
MWNCAQKKAQNLDFLHDKAPAHKELSVKQFMAQKSITEMEHPLYSPDLALNDLWLFPKIKSVLKGRRFQDSEDIKKCDYHWKLFNNRSSKNVSNSGSIIGLSAAQWEYFESDPSQ